MSRVVIGVPVKPFGVAKQRLAAVLGSEERARLGQALAERTVAAVAQGGATPLVLSADDQVTVWARSIGVDVLLDEGSSLNRAAAVAVDHIRSNGAAWGILHADVPTLLAADLATPISVLETGGALISPSSDGGTSMIGASVDVFEFRYGPGSFHRHLAALGRSSPHVFVSRGLALDLDTPADLEAAAGVPEGSWLAG